jgi:hypothetical protein
LVGAPGAGLGRADVTRRWALVRGGPARFAGLTRPEGEAAAAWLAALTDAEWELALVPIALPVVISDGAGPYMLDAGGRLILAVADHPRVADARVAMGPAEPDHPIGAVRAAPGGAGWRWLARADVAPELRLEALDALDAAADEAALERWAVRFAALA